MAMYYWANFLWFTSFHTSGSTMMTNKRNMFLEMAAFMFLVTRENVSQTRRTAPECNEHYYGLWRMIQPKLNMEQIIRIVQKSIIRLMSIFRSGIFTSRSQTSFSGYKETFSNLISSSQASGGAQ